MRRSLGPPPARRPPKHDAPQNIVLVVSLQAAVPLWVFEFQKRPYAELLSIAAGSAMIVGAKGDALQFKGKTRKSREDTAEAFNALAKGLAVLSFSPGGVTFCGVHFENRHPECAA